MKRIYKNVIYIIFVSFIVLLLFNLNHYIQYRTYSKYYYVQQSWIDIVGTITATSHAPRGLGSRFDYSYNGKNYQRVQSAVDIKVYNMLVGEKYILKVNPENPSKYVPIVWQPVFLDDEETQRTMGTIVNIKKTNFDISAIIFTYTKKLISPESKYEIYFKYNVGETAYERGQYLSPYINPVESNIRVGDKFEVQYMTDNPSRAIIKIGS